MFGVSDTSQTGETCGEQKQVKPRMLSISEVSVQTQGDDTVRVHLHSGETSIKYEDRGGKDVGFFFFFNPFLGNKQNKNFSKIRKLIKTERHKTQEA